MISKEKNFQDFLSAVSKLEPVEYCGLCKVLCVPMVDENKEAISFDETLEQVIDKFLRMSRKPRRQLMKVLKALMENDKDGTDSKN